MLGARGWEGNAGLQHSERPVRSPVAHAAFSSLGERVSACGMLLLPPSPTVTRQYRAADRPTVALTSVPLIGAFQEVG